MIAIADYLKRRLRNTVMFNPLKFVGALLGRATYPLPFHAVVKAEPYLARASRRLGVPTSDRSFYSYLSEIWNEGYEQGMIDQYQVYLPHIPRTSRSDFLDIGCGAGEFVEFLGQNDVAARGVDINAVEVARATERGLPVELADATTYLRGRKGQLAGVSMLQVVEHLEPAVWTGLLTDIFDALEPGGIVILETVNPKHAQAFNSFYVDPTHTRPIPSELLSFMVQWAGFTDVKIIFTMPIAYTHEQSLDIPRAYVHYAVLASKPHATP